MIYVSKSHAMGPAYRNNKTVCMLHRICKLIYFSSGANFWFEDMDYPPILMNIYNKISQVLEVIVLVFIVSGWGPLYTQHNLTEKQINDMYLFTLSHVVVYFAYANALYYKQEVRELVLILAVRLKEVCNDEMTERMLIRSLVRLLTALSLMCGSTLLSYGLRSGVQSLTSNATFTTVIPIWPDVEDRRLIAAIARILHYIIWCVLVVRVYSIFLIILSINICVAHQFKNLCKYFEGLNSIFEEAGTQRDKEKRYEDAFKVGIKMHSLTLWCTKQSQLAGGVVFSARVIINISAFVMLMLQMMVGIDRLAKPLRQTSRKATDRTLAAVLPIVLTVGSVLIGTGIFMLIAGDVTIEASHLPAAMFHSGWHNCQNESSVRVRKLITIAISLAQERVVIKSFGFIELSYESYVTIVKSSYSLFSVIY